MAEASPAPMMVDEFLVWAEGRPGRYELERQRVLAMSPESVGHLMAKAPAFNALAAAIARAGAPCRALTDGATVRIDETTAYERDAITTRILGAGALLLDPPRLDLAVEDLFGPAEVET